MINYKYKKMTVTCVVLSLFILIGLSVPICQAEAQTFEQRIPNYGLYCKDADIIKSGTVEFDMTDSELLEQGTGLQKSKYQVAGTNHEVEFAIPFISSSRSIPSVSVTVNGQVVEGSIWYGEGVFGTDNIFDIETVYSPTMDENITGTLYTVIPDNDTITISLSFTDRKSYIYETSNHLSSSHSEDGSHTWTLQNALSQPNYSFFIVGEATGHTFTSSCEYQTETLTCKEFIEKQYEKFKEYYDDCGGISVEFFYAIVDRALINKTSIRYNELFFNSIDTYRLNAYKFKVLLDTDSIVDYEIPISVQRNYAFEPMIYLVEHKQVANCPTTYIAELNDNIPYIIESSIKTQKSGLTYTASTADGFYFVFSSSEKPINKMSENNENETRKIVLIVCIVVGSIVVILFVIAIGIMVYKRKRFIL